MEGYMQIEGGKAREGEKSVLSTTKCKKKVVMEDWRTATKDTMEICSRRDVKIPLMIMVVVLLAQQCSGYLD